MKKFNNTLVGTDCGDAGLPAHSCGIAKAKTVLRVVPKTASITNSIRTKCGATTDRSKEARQQTSQYPLQPAPGYEIAKGQYMVVEDEETEAVQIESGGSLNYDERRRDRTSAALDRSPPKMTNAR
jgi:hypothetical protein